MRGFYLLLIALLTFSSSYGQSSRLAFKTDYGDIKVLLYDFTPKHRELILRSVKDSVYAGTLFNRIISGFVVQGGEHDVDIAKREAADSLHRKPRLAPEFDDRAFHKVGALGAGRDDNPEKSSFLNQLYFVVGKAITGKDLDALELKKGKKFTKEQRKVYLSIGGQPRLDGDYTIFGEVYDGLDVLMRISKVKTDDLDYPITPVRFEIIPL